MPCHDLLTCLYISFLLFLLLRRERRGCQLRAGARLLQKRRRDVGFSREITGIRVSALEGSVYWGLRRRALCPALRERCPSSARRGLSETSVRATPTRQLADSRRYVHRAHKHCKRQHQSRANRLQQAGGERALVPVGQAGTRRMNGPLVSTSTAATPEKTELRRATGANGLD